MNIIKLKDQLIPIEVIIDKNINSITFKETISLVFHSAYHVAENIFEEDNTKWKDFCVEFEKQLKRQNEKSWPYLRILKNDKNRRIDIILTGTPLISTTNFFVLLLRLLYIENYKKMFTSMYYHQILDYKQRTSNNMTIKHISLADIYKHLKKNLEYYIQVYNDEKYYENQLARSLLKQLDELTL